VGTKLDGIGLGGSIGPLNFDLYSGVKQLKIDGKSVPQTFGFSLSIAEVF
jgi:hypothetical protein